MRIVWFPPELGEFSSGIVNHSHLFIDYLHKHPDVQEIAVVRYPLPEHGVMPPFYQEIQGVKYYTPRISMEYHDAFKSVLQEDLKFLERLKIRFFKLALKFKRIKRLETDKIKKWGKIEYGLMGFASAQLPFPNTFQKQIGHCIAQFHPDIIQAHVELFSVASATAKDSAKAHLSFLASVEEEMENLPPRTITKVFWDRLEQAMDWLNETQAVDLFIAASKFVKSHLQKCGVASERIRVVQSPIAIKRLEPISKEAARSKLGLPPDKRVILSVGRMIDRKRFIDIVRILNTLPEDVIYYIKRSLCTSDDFFPSAMNELQKEVRQQKLEHRVIINSEIIPYDQMQQIYSAADVVTLPYLHEPFGMCAAEAMAVGRPLVVYDSGYLPEFIDGNGFVVEPRNLESLHAKIESLLDDPKLAAEMGAKGPELVKQFDIQVLGEKLLDIYQEFM